MVCRARILNLANINSCNLSEFENFLEWDRDQHFCLVKFIYKHDVINSEWFEYIILYFRI